MVNVVLLGGAPSNAIEIVLRHTDWPVQTRVVRARDFFDWSLDTIFFENSARNFLFFLLLKVAKVIGLFNKEIGFFIHGDHHMPIARKNYSFFVNAIDWLFLNLCDFHCSHSFVALALAKRVTLKRNIKRKKYLFDVESFVTTLRPSLGTLCRNRMSIFYIDYPRSNKVMPQYLTKIKVAYGLPVQSVNFPVDVPSFLPSVSFFAIPSESESLSLIGVEAAHFGVHKILISKRVGLKEYRAEVRRLMPNVSIEVIA